MDSVGLTQAPTTAEPPTRSRGFSFKSDQSGASKGSKPREDPTESSLDKQRRDTFLQSSKANPNAAFYEAQPAVANLLEEATIQSLRGVQHRDAQGNIITDPDLSNPTRPRLERPLDTIRSFERAVENGYRRKTSYQRSESYEQQGGASRRNSYFGNGHNSGGYDNSPGPNRQSQYGGGGGGGGYYGNQSRDGHLNTPGPSNGSRTRPSPGARQPSESMYGQPPRTPGQHGYQHSQDTTNTHGSDVTGPWASGTDPSSDNSSMERISNNSWYANNNNNGNSNYTYAPNGHGQPNGAGGANSFPGSSIPEDGAYSSRPRGETTRKPIALGNSANPSKQLPQVPRPEPEKRKSWLQRTFSKRESR